MLINDEKLLGGVRSNEWPKVRAEHLKLHPVCECCGGNKKIEVHHVKPYHLNPELELEPTNLLTLCENKKQGLNCHLCLGHSGSYKSYNVDVVKDVEYFNNKFKNRP